MSCTDCADARPSDYGAYVDGYAWYSAANPFLSNASVPIYAKRLLSAQIEAARTDALLADAGQLERTIACDEHDISSVRRGRITRRRQALAHSARAQPVRRRFIMLPM